MILQAVGAQLPYVVEITHGECGAPEPEVEQELLLNLEARGRRGEHHVVVVVATRENLVVALPVVWREGQARHWHGSLIAKGKGLALDAEAPYGHDRRGNAQREFQLRGIVAVARVVDASQGEVAKKSEPHVQPGAVHVVMPTQAQVVHGAQEGVGVATRAGLRHQGLLRHERGPLAQPRAGGVATRHKLAVEHLLVVAQLQARGFFLREICVEDVDMANAYQAGLLFLCLGARARHEQ